MAFWGGDFASIGGYTCPRFLRFADLGKEEYCLLRTFKNCYVLIFVIVEGKGMPSSPWRVPLARFTRSRHVCTHDFLIPLLSEMRSYERIRLNLFSETILRLV
jgi:hypothetical protein